MEAVTPIILRWPRSGPRRMPLNTPLPFEARVARTSGRRKILLRGDPHFRRCGADIGVDVLFVFDEVLLEHSAPVCAPSASNAALSFQVFIG